MELRPASPQQALPFIDRKSCGAVYPLSIVGGFQQGDCFICGDNALLWHECGFAYTFGDAKMGALKKIHKQFLSPEAQPERRFLLFVTDEKARSFFEKKKDLVIGTRYFFEFRSEEPAYRLLPKGMHLREIDGLLFDSLPGRITPPFSWDNATQFMTFGHGYCIMDGDTPAAWAFTAAVSSEEIDIGVETAPGYRRRGLAALAAEAMIRYTLGRNKRPVWACSSENEASRRLAEKLGFVKCGECLTVTAKQDQKQ